MRGEVIRPCLGKINFTWLPISYLNTLLQRSFCHLLLSSTMTNSFSIDLSRLSSVSSSTNGTDKKGSFEGSASLEAHQQQPGFFRFGMNIMQFLQQWQSALNQTITFRKPDFEETQDNLPPVPEVPSRLYVGRSVSGRLQTGKTMSGRPLVSGVHHGHKVNILLKALPEGATTA